MTPSGNAKRSRKGRSGSAASRAAQSGWLTADRVGHGAPFGNPPAPARANANFARGRAFLSPRRGAMPFEIREDPEFLLDALAYVTQLYQEVARENGAPTLGTQNQVVDFIRAEPELRDYVRGWARGRITGEETLDPPARLPQDPLYWRIPGEMLRDIAH